jgi:hypothetical protein
MSKKMISCMLGTALLFSASAAYADTASGTSAAGTVSTSTTNSGSVSVSPAGAPGSSWTPQQLAQQAGLTPDNFFYRIKILFEELQTFLTFDPAKKAKLEAEHAMERMAEAAKMEMKGKPDVAEQLTNQAAALMAAATAEAQAAQQQKEDTTSVDQQTAAVRNAEKVLAQLLPTLPPQAREAVKEALAKIEKHAEDIAHQHEKHRNHGQDQNQDEDENNPANAAASSSGAHISVTASSSVESSDSQNSTGTENAKAQIQGHIEEGNTAPGQENAEQRIGQGKEHHAQRQTDTTGKDGKDQKDSKGEADNGNPQDGASHGGNHQEGDSQD